MLLNETVAIGLRGLESLTLPTTGRIAEMATMDLVSSLDAHQPGMSVRGLVVDAGNAVHRIDYPILLMMYCSKRAASWVSSVSKRSPNS